MRDVSVFRALSVATTKAAPPANLTPVDGRGVWHSLWNFTSQPPENWQRDIEVRPETVLAQATVFACITLIASDIAKLDLRLVARVGEIWQATESTAFTPVLRKPNDYQTRQLFVEQWVISLLSTGNTYALKERDDRNVVRRLHILDPNCVRPLVAPDGSVYYALGQDVLAGVQDYDAAVPASEIIHDRMNCLFHPLVGLSPIFASGLAAMQALKIQTNSSKFFENASRPGGVLTAPAQIKDETAKRIKDYWEANFRGDRAGAIAVLGDGLSYQAMAVTPVDAQLVEQLKMSAEQICSTFHVPAYMVGVGAPPAYNNIEALNQQYYNQCLQARIESIEAFLDEGLGLSGRLIEGRTLATQFDLDDLLRMDTATLVKTLNDSVAGGWMKPNEARAKRSMLPVTGGDTPYLQQQNYALAALAKRDASADPFATAKPPAPSPAPAPAPPAPTGDEAKTAELQTKEFLLAMSRLFEAEPVDG